MTAGNGHFPRFDAEVADGGYRWWYIDAESSDRRYHLVLILFIGSVFSPFYARARRRDADANPAEHCAVNLALYSWRRLQWAMSEYDASALSRTATELSINASHVRWTGDELIAQITETGTPIPVRVRGTIRVRPQLMTTHERLLDPNGRHRWWPVAPKCDVEVTLERPDMHWHGHGYFDTNHGDELLQDGFDEWNWSRRHGPGDTIITYNARPRGGEEQPLRLRVKPDGDVEALQVQPQVRLDSTFWGLPRVTREGEPLRVRRTLEDTPFYSRSALGVPGQPDTSIVHEGLCLHRLRKPWVHALIPFRTRPHWR